MTDFQALVRQFHEASGQTVGTEPEFPHWEVVELRRRLIEEEATEARDALAMREFPETAQELADLLYVVFGTAVSLGIDLEPVFKEVHKANMAKVRDGVERDARTGKILKPPGWTTPDVASVLRKQGWEGP